MEKEYQLLSALVVFSSLKRQGKQLLEILDSFINLAIEDIDRKTFTHIEVSDYLKNEFGFSVPSSVIEKGIKRIVKNEQKITYDNAIKKFCCQKVFDNKNIQAEVNQATSEEERLIESLGVYLGSDEDRNVLRQELVNYFLGNSQGKYSFKINKFVIKNRENPIMQNIANGIILYNGLRYQSMYDNKGWEKLNIYINMEIIFHYMGYNGKLFATIIKELFELIDEVNRKKRVINLYYTSREEQRIENFFTAIIKNQSGEDTVAAKTIRKKIGNDEIKIRAEKARLFGILQERIIFKQDIPEVDFNLEKNQQYNVASIEIKEKIPDLEEGKVEFLNKLNILRANNKATIENSKYLFLTDESEYREISKYIKDAVDGRFPIAIQIAHLTNILWIKLGKLTKNSNELLIFKPDTRAKASIALNLHKNNLLLQRKLEEVKEMDKKIAQEVLAEIVSSDIGVDDIDENSVDTLVDMSGVDLDYFLDQRRQREETISAMGDEIKNLKKERDEIKNKNQALEEQEREWVQKHASQEFEIKNLKQKQCGYLRTEYNQMEKKLRQLKTAKWFMYFMFTLCSVGLIFLMQKFECLNIAVGILVNFVTNSSLSYLGNRLFFKKAIEKCTSQLEDLKKELIEMEHEGEEQIND